MSKSSKSRAKEKRKKAKQAEKARKRALYAAYRDSGKNIKSKRNRLQTARKAKSLRAGHTNANCGNAGCIKCSGIKFSQFISKDGKSRNMPQHMWLRWRSSTKTS